MLIVSVVCYLEKNHRDQSIEELNNILTKQQPEKKTFVNMTFDLFLLGILYFSISKIFD